MSCSYTELTKKPCPTCTAAAPTTPAKPLYKTQKARGIMLRRITEQFEYYATPRVFSLDSDTLEGDLRYVFDRAADLGVRFCPVNPNHGGACDSEFFIGVDRAIELSRHAKRLEPGGELITMRSIYADRNAILTPNAITVGPGHDGATAGKSSRVFPISHADLTWAEGVIADGEVPFIEAVRADHRDICPNKVYEVQARSGPAVPASLRFVPSEVEVTGVYWVTDDTDMLTWGDTVKAFKPGTVICHKGGNMSSHFAVHSVLYNVPFLCTGPWPSVGDTLAEEGEGSIEWDEATMTAGFACGLRENLDDPKGAVYRAVFTLHESLAFARHTQGQWLIGHACSTMLRLGLAVAAGEARHSRSGTQYSRDHWYEQALTEVQNYAELRTKLPEIFSAFADYAWCGTYGGDPWATIAKAVWSLDCVMQDVVNPDNPATWSNALEALNVMVNLVHNGGWWLNKFASSELYDRLAKGHTKTLIRAAMYSYDLLEKQKSCPDLELDALTWFREGGRIPLRRTPSWPVAKALRPASERFFVPGKQPDEDVPVMLVRRNSYNGRVDVQVGTQGNHIETTVVYSTPVATWLERLVAQEAQRRPSLTNATEQRTWYMVSPLAQPPASIREAVKDYFLTPIVSK